MDSTGAPEVVRSLEEQVALRRAATMAARGTPYLREVVQKVYHANLVDLMDQAGLADMSEEQVKRWRLHIEPLRWRAVERLRMDGEERTLYLVNADNRGYALRRITVVGKTEVRVSEVPMTANASEKSTSNSHTATAKWPEGTRSS